MSTKIEKNWFYRLSDFYNVSDIKIWDNLEVVIFDDWISNKKLSIWKNTILKVCWFLDNKQNYNILFNQVWDNSNVEIKYLLLSKDSNKTKVKIHSKIESNNSKSDVFISSICWNLWEIDLDWVIELSPNFKKMSGHLIEENIFLWDKWKIRWIPTLLVKSNEVEASHACKIEKISEDDLFYLRSRWISKDSAIHILIESKLKNIFKSIENMEFYSEFLDETMRKVFM